jgi:hypothetical protein
MTYRLGKLPAKSSLKALLFSDYLKAEVKLPEATNFWTKRKPFPLRSFGNTEIGDCTRASQAHAAMRMERVECRRTPSITDQEVERVYFDMTARLYGGGDTGAYETDALSEWRKPDLTFRDTHGRPLTIDAFTKVNVNQKEIMTAIYTTGAHGIKICFNLPLAFEAQTSSGKWDIPDGQRMTDEWLPNSWGGHSTYAQDYTKDGIILETNWGIKPILVTWRAVLAYADESHWIIDSLDAWRKKPAAKNIDLNTLKADVNAVSSQKI